MYNSDNWERLHLYGGGEFVNIPLPPIFHSMGYEEDCINKFFRIILTLLLKEKQLGYETELTKKLNESIDHALKKDDRNFSFKGQTEPLLTLLKGRGDYLYQYEIKFIFVTELEHYLAAIHEMKIITDSFEQCYFHGSEKRYPKNTYIETIYPTSLSGFDLNKVDEYDYTCTDFFNPHYLKKYLVGVRIEEL